MKKLNPVLLSFVLMGMGLTLSAPNQASAREKSRAIKSVTQTDMTSSSASAPESDSTVSVNLRFGLGYTAMSRLMTNSTAVASLIEFSPRFVLQPMLSLAGTSPRVQFTFGTLAKYTILKQGLSGFHLGGGFSLGTLPAGANDSVFAFAFNALAGFHFPIPGTQNIMVHIDGGPVFSHVGGAGTADSTNNFAVDSFSPAFGLTIAYMF